jgi:hypothetical protein
MNNQCSCLSRRLVNAFLASTIAWPFSRAVPSFLSKQLNLQKSFQCLLLSLFGNLRSACAIGTACLNSLPQETSTTEQLANEILAAASCDTETMKSKETVRHQIANRVRDDFAQGAIISVDGWLLSLTEARVYALVTLTLGHPEQ